MAIPQALAGIPPLSMPSTAVSSATSGGITNGSNPFPFAAPGQSSAWMLWGVLAIVGMYVWKKTK